ncbi:MAG TPA: putative glycoside hydrolase [Candidatus Polarisedimenticolia bacterium]
MRRRAAAALLLCFLAASPTLVGGAAPRTARHCLVALGTIRDYHVPGARYDLVIVSPETPLDAALKRARRAHPDALVLGYLNTMDMNELMPGARSALRRNEDWFLHDATGRRVQVRIDKYQGSRARYGMNVSRTGYQDFLAARAIEILGAGYDGLHLDNVETDSSYHPRHVGSFISALPVELDHESWPGAERAMLQRIRAKVTEAGFGERPIVINDIRSGEPEVSRLYLREVEGANCENWLSRDRPHDGPFGWKAKVDQAAEVARGGKILNLICKTPSVGAEESLYLFASYLLALDGDRLYFYHGSGYRPESTRWHDFYDLDIGRPEGDMARRDGLYVRGFTAGFVAVNPFDGARTITLPEGLVDAAYEPVSSLTLKAKSAALLMRADPAAGRRVIIEGEDLALTGRAVVQAREGASGGKVLRFEEAQAEAGTKVDLEPGRYRLVVDGFGENPQADACFVRFDRVEKRIYFAAGHRPFLEVQAEGGSRPLSVRAAEPGVMLDRLVIIRLASR